MKIGIDYAKTITSYPSGFSLLTKILSEAGHEVHIITGVSGKEKESRSEGLERMKITYHKLVQHDDSKHTDRDKVKGMYCRDCSIDLMFEDNEGYIEDIKRWSPETKIIKIDKNEKKE